MKKEDCFYLGKIIRKYSYKGEVLAKLDTDEPELYEDMDAVFISISKNLIPFMVERSQLHKSDLLRIKLEDIDNEDDAQALMNSELFLPLDLLPKLEGNKFYFHEVIGFGVIDTEYGHIGEVVRINDQTAQALFIIQKEDKEILIPISDDIIQKVDRKVRQIEIDAPNGLIGLYLDE